MRYRTLSDRSQIACEALESALLYAVLPVFGHREVLRLVYAANRAQGRIKQSLEHAQSQICHRASLAHETDLVHAQISMRDLEIRLHETRAQLREFNSSL